MPVERYAALHDDDRSYVVDRSRETAPGVHPIIREWPPRQWKAANEYARARNAIDNPPAREPRLYPGHRTLVVDPQPGTPGYQHLHALDRPEPATPDYRDALDAAIADFKRRHKR